MRARAVVLWRRVPHDVAVFTAYQLGIVLVILLFAATHGLGLHALSFRFRQWDTNWLLSIAHHGYRPDSERGPAIAFFPLYPALVRAVMVVVRKDVMAAFLVTTVCSIAGHTAFYRALRSRSELADIATSTLVLFALWPMALYFSLLYTEGLYLALTAGFLCFLFADRVGLAAVAAAFAALTRQPGFLCVVPLALWIVTDTGRPWTARVRRLGWVGVAASGYAVFLLINRIVYGSWFAFVSQLRSHWLKRTAPLTETIPAAIRFLLDPNWYFGWTNVADHLLVLATLVVFVAWPLACRRRFDRCRWVLLAWGGVQWVFIASSSSVKEGVGWISSTRYLMLVLPLFVAIADLARNRRWVISALGATGTVFGLMVFDRWIHKRWTA